MSAQYASSQPAGFRNRIENVAIVGASGQVGGYLTREILKLGHQKVTAITRKGSNATMPDGVVVKTVDYDDLPSIVEALHGQDALVITMGSMAPADTQQKLIDAAAKTGVHWIIPNGWSYEPGREQLQKDLPVRAKAKETHKYIEKLRLPWTSVACGFWYEFSLAGTMPQPERRFGFNFDAKTLVLYDDGTTKLNVSTWPQTGRGTAKLLDLKMLREDEHDKGPCLDDFRNRHVYINSFRLNQRDMLESVLRVTGDKESDWKITKQPVQQRFQEGGEELKTGDRMGFVKQLYARYFYPDLEGDAIARNLYDNDVLGLPKEDLDEFTKTSLDMKAQAKT